MMELDPKVLACTGVFPKQRSHIRAPDRSL